MYLSGVSIDVNQELWVLKFPAATFGSLVRVMLHFTSSLVKSRPECHCTPLRRDNLICLRSLLVSQLSASMGCGSSLSL